MKYPEILEFESNESLEGFARLVPDVVYSRVGSEELKMTLIVPWSPEGDTTRRPLVVFVQGSAWQKPDVNFEIPQLSQLARDGYVMATIVHRNSLDGNPYPAFLQDTKTAIRFLRANSAKFGIDTKRVCIYGTSSGGNTSLLVGVTGDAPEFRTDEYSEESDTVQLVVECFGPSDLPKMIDIERANNDSEAASLFYALAGKADPADVLERMSPVNYVKPGMKLPPFFLLHGDADPVVPYDQSVEMYQKLIDCGAEARLARVHGAPHEGSFWSRALVNEIFGFIKAKL